MERLLTAEAIEGELAPMLVGGIVLHIDTMLDQAWRVVESFVKLSPAEADYVTSVGLGELRPELLMPAHPELVSVLTRHPAIRWKLDNVKRHLSKKS